MSKREKIKNAVETANEYIDENPKKAVCIAAGVGLSFGLLSGIIAGRIRK